MVNIGFDLKISDEHLDIFEEGFIVAYKLLSLQAEEAGEELPVIVMDPDDEEDPAVNAIPTFFKQITLTYLQGNAGGLNAYSEERQNYLDHYNPDFLGTLDNYMDNNGGEFEGEDAKLFCLGAIFAYDILSQYSLREGTLSEYKHSVN